MELNGSFPFSREQGIEISWESPKCEPVGTFLEISGKKSPKTWVDLVKLPSFPLIRENAVPFVTRNSENSKQNFFIEWEYQYYNTSKGTGKRGHIVADTLLLMMFPCARKLGNICCGHKLFLNKIRNIFCPDTKFVSATNVARAGKRGNIFVGNNVSATMCPRLPVAFASSFKALPNEDTLLRTHCCRHKSHPVCPRAQILCPGHKKCF